MSGGTSAAIRRLLEKMRHWDKDERYMATNDICAELDKDYRIDQALERQLCSAILAQLDDASAEVQSVAIKCLAVLFRKAQSEEIAEIGQKLCTLIVSGKLELRDVYSIGLKTLISTVPESTGSVVAKLLCSSLLNALNQKVSDLDSADVKKECLDNLFELLNRFGSDISNEYEDIRRIISNLITFPKPAIQKKAGNVLGVLSTFISDDMLHTLTSDMADKLNKAGNEDVKRIYIQTYSIICRSTASRLTGSFPDLLAIFEQGCGSPGQDFEDVTAFQMNMMNEFREQCLNAVEAIAATQVDSPEMMNQIVSLATSFANFDPNFCGSDNDGQGEEEGDADMDVDEYEEDEFGDDYGDFGGESDDDSSWKVRKAALKIMRSLLANNDLLLQGSNQTCVLMSEVLSTLVKTLLRRLKERVEIVLSEVVDTITLLLERSRKLNEMKNQHDKTLSCSAASKAVVMTHLAPLCSTFIKILSEKTTSENAPVKSNILIAIEKLIRFVKDDVSLEYVQGFTEASSNLLSVQGVDQSIILATLKALCGIHNSAAIGSIMLKYNVSSKVSNLVIKSNSATGELVAQDKLLRNSSSALLSILGVFISIKTDQMCISTVTAMYSEIFKRLTLVSPSDPRELRKTLLSILAYMLCNFEFLDAGIVLTVIEQIVGNESVQGNILQYLSQIATRKFHTDPYFVGFSSTSSNIIFELVETSIVKGMTSPPNSAARGQAALALSFVSSVASLKGVNFDFLLSILNKVCSASIDWIFDGDEVCTNVYRFCNILLGGSQKYEDAPPVMTCVSKVCNAYVNGTKVLPEEALTEFQSCVQLLIAAAPVPSQEQQAWIGKLNDGGSKSQTTMKCEQIARCIANFVHVKDISKPNAVISLSEESLFGLFKKCTGDATVNVFHLYLIGSLYHLVMKSPGMADASIGAINNGLSSSHEEIRNAACVVLGSLACDNSTFVLPFIYQGLQNPDSTVQYAHLSAMRKYIGSSPDIAIDNIFNRLQECCGSQDEAVQVITAECFALLIRRNPDTLRLLDIFSQSVMKENAAEKRFTFASIFRFAFGKALTLNHIEYLLAMLQRIGNINEALVKKISEEPISVVEIEISKACLLAIESLIRFNLESLNVAKCIVGNGILAFVVRAVQFTQERVVDLGAFKHKVDDGESIARTAMCLLEAIVDSVELGEIDSVELLSVLSKCLNRKDDSKINAYQITCKIIAKSPKAIAVFSNSSEFSGMLNTLKETATKFTTARSTDTSKVDHDRLQQLVVAKLLITVTKSPSFSASNGSWTEFVKQIAALMDLPESSGNTIGPIYRTLLQESVFDS